MTKNLIIFNLKTDADDDVLGFTTDWINGFAKKWNKIFVITMTKGTVKVAKNVDVYSVGKEKGYWEIRRIYEFYKIFFKITRENQIDGVFAHMAPEFAILAGPFCRLKKIPLVLWYAHKSITWRLRLAVFFADRVVASTPEGFRLKTEKLEIVGQGIDESQFRYKKINPGSTLKLFTVGRISPVKKIDEMLALVNYLKNNLSKKVALYIYGRPLTSKDEDFLSVLKKMVLDLDLKDSVFFEGAIPHHAVSDIYHLHDYFVNFSETGSFDKSILEAIFSGNIVLSTNDSYKNMLIENNASQLLIERPNQNETILKILKKNVTYPPLFVKAIISQNHLAGLVDKITNRIVTTYASKN